MRRDGKCGALLMSLSVCVAVTSCGPPATHQEGRAAAPSASIPAWATTMLQRYDDAFEHASPGRPLRQVGSWTRQVGEWEQSTAGDRPAQALATGLVERAASLPRAPAGDRAIKWEDGTTRKAPLISAAQAEQALLVDARTRDAQGECSGCKPLKVTGATLTTMTIGTTHGRATVPAWRLQLDGTQVTLLRPAVDPQPVVALTPFMDRSVQPPNVSNSQDLWMGVSRDLLITS